jgi:hypothetical protein
MKAMNEAHQTIGKIRSANNVKVSQIEMGGKMTFSGWTYADAGWEDE